MLKTHDDYDPPRRMRIHRFSSGKRVTLNERRIRWLQAIHHHGPLAASILHKFTEHLCRSDKRTRSALNDLFHEDNTLHGGPYLSRPSGQFDTIDARYNQLMYDLAPAGEQALKDLGLWSDNAPLKRKPWDHDANLAAFTASLELGFIRRRLPYKLRHQILDEAGSTIAIDVPIQWNGKSLTKTLELDSIMSVNNGNKDVGLAIEWDQGTEPGKTDVHTRKSYRRSILQHRTLIGEGLYREHFKMDHGMITLFAFKSPVFHNKFMDVLKGIMPSSNYMCSQTVPDIPLHFKPLPLLTSPFENGWQRSGKPPLILYPFQA